MKHITVIGRRWFEKTNGNTYHSVEVYLQGVCVAREDFCYGYGNQYEHTALEILQKHTKAKYRKDFLDCSMLWQVKEKGYTLISSVTDVAKRKDL